MEIKEEVREEDGVAVEGMIHLQVEEDGVGEFLLVLIHSIGEEEVEEEMNTEELIVEVDILPDSKGTTITGRKINIMNIIHRERLVLLRFFLI